mgnify:CR=1 FL=1
MIWSKCLFSIIKDSFHLGFFRAHTAKMQFSHTCSYRISPMVNKKMHSNQGPQIVFDLIRKGGFFVCNCQSSPLLIQRLQLDLKIVLVLITCKVNIEKSRSGRFLWNRNWDLGRIGQNGQVSCLHSFKILLYPSNEMT